MPDDSGTSDALLGATDPPACTVVNAEAAGRVVLACDHASNAIPRVLDGLGLPPGELERQIAWDEGACEVARRLAARLDARCVMAGYSRLVIDCNRAPDNETSIPAISDGTVVPGNAGLGAQDRARRRAAVFEPYHRTLAGALDAVCARGQMPVLIAVHSFTPVMDGLARPWHVAVLWAHDARIPVPLIAALRASGGLMVGDNEPYSGREQYGYTMDVHAGTADIPHALIEIRADQIADAAGIARYGEILARAIEAVLAGLGTTEARRIGS